MSSGSFYLRIQDWDIITSYHVTYIFLKTILQPGEWSGLEKKKDGFKVRICRWNQLKGILI